MDMPYAIIPVFGGVYNRLFREVQLAYLISDHRNHTNHLIYTVDQDPGSCIVHMNDDATNCIPILNKTKIKADKNKKSEEKISKMFFDGSFSKEGLGTRVVLIWPSNETISLSYKLDFETTNNIEEYQALVLGLRVAKYLKILSIHVFGDSKLIIQVKNVYQTKQQRFKLYRNEVWDLINNLFLDFNISYISRDSN